MEDTQNLNTAQFPVGTIVYYGPDNQTVTKIQAGIVFKKDEPPLHRTWQGDEVASDPIVVAELGQFFTQHGVKKVVMTSSVAGCPHEEGLDYPAGQDCPLCPFWKKKAVEGE